MNTQPPLEDINAVVSRFQAWAGAQQAPSRAKNGVRELTYEEAIQSNRSCAGSKKPSQEIEPAPVPVVKTQYRDTGKKTTPKKRIAARRNARAIHRKDVARPVEPAPAAFVKPQSFQQVLVENVSILTAAPPPRDLTAIQRKTTAVSLRVSSAEHGLLKRRAAEANLSVSGYVRNCVLEVESLRVQLAGILSEQNPREPQVSQRFTFAACLHFVRKLFVKNTTGLAIRA